MTDSSLMSKMLAAYRYMLQSRYIDQTEEEMTSSGEAFFHVSGAGHEAIVTLHDHLIADDWIHCHYRDKSLMLARGIPIDMFFLATLNKDSSHSRGRQMNAHMSARDLNIMSMVGPVGNNALQSVGVAEVIKDKHNKPIVLCGMGDGTTQQGEVLEALGHASGQMLPVLFVIEDNALAISTSTEHKTFFSTSAGEQSSFQGIPISHIDGSDAIAVHEHFADVVGRMRRERKPEIVRFKVERLSHHTNADDQSVYRTEDQIAQVRKTHDPITILRRWLLENGSAEKELVRIEAEMRAEVASAADRARDAGEPQHTIEAKRPLPEEVGPDAVEYLGNSGEGERYTMLEAIRATLRTHLQDDDAVMLFGEDIEDPKGDVFGITKGLSTEFGSRVRNSPLAEASVVGISVGNALAGARPVAFLQFADFLPIAYNQIFAEMGSMYWRTDGDWQVPMILMITCGAYRPGLGPFHASSLEAIAAHTPGIDVFMPSGAADAAGLLNAAFLSQRPTLFFYPKSCLNDRERSTSTDVRKQLVPIGRARKTRDGDALTLVGWGNTVGLCEKVADTIGEHGIACDVIDLRSIVPWDVDCIIESVRKTNRLIIVHEDNHTAGMGAEIAATIAERIPSGITIRRITRPDTFVPCNFPNQLSVLPSFKRILETGVELFGGQVDWKRKPIHQPGIEEIEAIGSSPSDEAITVMAWLIKEGQKIKKGQVIAELEADKASVELRASQGGIVGSLVVKEGQTVKVGEALGFINIDSGARVYRKQQTKDNPGEPIISNLQITPAIKKPTRSMGMSHTKGNEITVGIVDICCKTGSKTVSNKSIVKHIPQWKPEDILRRTGIENRNWVDGNESALTLAVDASKQLIKKLGISFGEIGLILCSTETPLYHTPSMATLLQGQLKGEEGEEEGFFCPAYDINAACTGYVYALQIAYDFLQSQPDSTVLLVTAEALSTRLNLADPNTAPIFADASTATLLASNYHQLKSPVSMFRPVTGANGEDGSILNVPLASPGRYIQMDGQRVFRRAVRDMITSLQKACENASVTLSDLYRIVAHQANQRILNAVSTRLKLKDKVMFSNIRNLGNTSSSTIPLGLSSLIHELKKNQYVGLTAFGGGFTFGGAILKAR